MKFILMVVIFSMLFGCSRPELNLHALQDKGDIVFEISTKNINGLIGCMVWEEDESEIFWDARLNYFSESKMIYGKVLPGFRQRLPAQGDAVSLPRDTKIFVMIEYQFDDQVSANAGAAIFAFIIRPDGEVENLGRQPYRIPPHQDQQAGPDSSGHR